MIADGQTDTKKQTPTPRCLGQAHTRRMELRAQGADVRGKVTFGAKSHRLWRG
jgi:hypothetical protein